MIFDGVDLGSLKHSELLRTRQRMSMIFQGFNLLAQRTALENVCYPLEIAHVKRKAAREKARKLLEIVGLGDRDEGVSLPALRRPEAAGGDRQGPGHKPQGSALRRGHQRPGSQHHHAILELLKKINAEMGVTVIVITHEMKVIEQICDRVAVIDQSHIVEQGLVKEVFPAPKSRIARELILPQTEAVEEVHGERKVRIVFDGNSAFEPVISNLTLECHAAVNILGADTKNVDGKAFGQMLLQLPEDEDAQSRIMNYLNTRRIPYEEVC